MKCSECSNQARPVVAVDIDGTLAQYHRAFINFAELWLNEERASFPRNWDGIGEFSDHLGIPKHVYRQMKLAFRSGGFKRWMPAFPDAGHFMNALNRMDVEIWVTTTRPWQRMDNVDPDTKEWLRRNGMQYQHLLFDEDKYRLLTELVDPDRIVAVLDDEAEQGSRCHELSLPFILRRNAFNMGANSTLGGRQMEVQQLDQALQMIKDRIGFQDALQQ